MAFEDLIVKYTQTVAELDAVDTTTLSDGQQASVENDGIYVLDKTADEWTQTTLKAPYVLSSYRGLKISEFLNTNDIKIDQKAQVAEAFYALLKKGRYSELDLEGRQVAIDGVMDFGAIWQGESYTGGGKIVRNGWFSALTDVPQTVNFTRSMKTEVGSTLVSISSTAGLMPGMYVSGPAVARETYIVGVELPDDGPNTFRINTRAWRSVENVTHRFQEFDYMFDFKNVDNLANFRFHDITFNALGMVSIFRGPKAGSTISFNRCILNQPKMRGITFWTSGGSNLQIDNCQGSSSTHERGLPPEERQSIFCTVSTNDCKFRGNYVWEFRHTLVLHGSGNVLTGNHFWQGQQKTAGEDPALNTRTASIILTSANNKTNITGNYIDNSWIELANDNTTAQNWPLGGGVTITGNQFTTVSKIGTYGFIALAPYKANSTCARISVVGNVFKNVDGGDHGTVVPMEKADVIIVPQGSNGSIDRSQVSQIYWRANSYSQVKKSTSSELTIEKVVAAGSETSTVGFSFQELFSWNFYPRAVLSTSVYSAKTATGVASPTPVMVDDNLGSNYIINMRLAEPRSGRFGITVSCNPPIEQ
ncbi:hypothetical protein ACYX78_14805 [Advenella incenata]